MIIEEIRKNKTKTFLIVGLFFAFVSIFIYFLGILVFDNIYIAVILGLGFSIISSFISYYNSDKIVLKINGARLATKEEFAQLNNSLEGLCLACGMSIPKLYVMEDSSMNAFATGRNPEHAVVCVTTGLLSNMDKYEIEGVLAHELSHIRNYDILVSTITIVMVGFVVILSDAFSRGLLRGNRKSNDRDNSGNAILMIIGLIFIILAPLFAQLLQLFLSRNREYLADASAIELTRNKDGLINALKRLSGDKTSTNANKATASMFIVNPFKGKDKDSILSTHPNINNRIDRLEKIQ